MNSGTERQKDRRRPVGGMEARGGRHRGRERGRKGREEGREEAPPTTHEHCMINCRLRHRRRGIVPPN